MKKPLIFIILILVLATVGVYFWQRSHRVRIDITTQVTPGNIPANSTCGFVDSISFNYYNVEQDNPLWKSNNKFGLYVYAEHADYFEIAQNLVNSNGGRWGYVLIPYNIRDRDYSKWERVFEQLRNKELIPVIQLHDVDINDYVNETDDAATFLNSLLWPIRYKYISVYNEPNDPNFWYGKANPEEYAKILDYTIDTFKKKNQDFFMLNGAMNTSAPNDGANIDAFTFLKQMNTAVPGIFDKLDGWASHSYPQPNFSGNPYVSGRWSIRAYDVELDFLKQTLGVKKELPVFITETGWAHAEGDSYNSGYLSADKVAENFKIAYEQFWLKDDRVRAVMPFTIWYDPPFDHFSWVNKDKVPYKHYDVIKSLKKVKGDPPRLTSGVSQLSTCGN